jgi:hypothetical protein
MSLDDLKPAAVQALAKRLLSALLTTAHLLSYGGCRQNLAFWQLFALPDSSMKLI